MVKQLDHIMGNQDTEDDGMNLKKRSLYFSESFSKA